MEKRNAEISRLFIQYHDVLKKYILSYTSYDPKYLSIADDYVQEVFYKAIKNYDQLKESPNTFGWLARCFTNMFRSEYRREKRREEIIGRQTSIEQCPEAMDTMDSILRWLSRIEEKELLDELLVTLTPFERTIFYEYFENRRTIHEIAEKCRYTEGAIRGAIQRIRAKARNLSFALLFLSIQCILKFLRTF